MESQSPKLSLDLSPPWLLSQHKKEPDKSSDYIARLEAELRKIEAFKRELPLSVLLLTDAIQRLKEQVVNSTGEEDKVASNLDEIPTTVTVRPENDKDGDKKTWMSSAQLWSSDQTLSLQLNSNKPGDGQACSKSTEKVGALSSVKDCPDLSHTPVDSNKLAGAGRGLFPVTSEPAGLKKEVLHVAPTGRPSSVSVLVDQLKLRYQSSPVQVPALQGQRKQRRCWSPELHRRFIDALERLGGSQVATPKQIRDLMQVDGLTNDEVKSHLQKYRLHIRKHPSSVTSSSRVKLICPQDSQPQGSSSGGAAALKVESTQSGSLHLAIGSPKCSSPATSKCDSMEDDYEEKSDSHSWEGD